MSFPALFSPFKFRQIELRNRLVLAPMTTYSSNPDGSLADDEVPYLERRAAGFGAIFTAACYVHPTGKAFTGQWSCSLDKDLPSLRRAADAIHRGGAAAILQIHHGGRRCPSPLSGRVLSASAVRAETPTSETPEPMSLYEIQEIVQAFGEATRRAKQAGFDGVEIHGANTYLLQQFVSPLTNLRTDDYGADRNRFPLEIVEACCQHAAEDFVIGYRFSPEEQEPEGLGWQQTASLVVHLSQSPLDFLHVSLRDFDQSSIRGEFTEPVGTKLLHLIAGRKPLIGVGNIRSDRGAERALEMGYDLLAIGRAGITEPEFPQKLRSGEAPRLKIPRQNPERLTLPRGLIDKIFATEPWFEIED